MATGNTYVPLATNTLSSAQASVTFSSISGAYTDLVLVISGNAGSGTSADMRFNSDSATNYSSTHLHGDGSSAGSYRETNSTSLWAGSFYSTSTPTTAIHHIMNYSNTTTYKTSLSRVNYTIAFTYATVGLWRSTAAVTSVTLSTSATFNTGSTFQLFGIAAA